MLRAARELLALRSPLDAELMVSEMLGTWWGQRAPDSSAHRAADLEELIGEGLVEYAGQHASPAALALLSGIACLGTPRQAALAEKAGLAMIERGVARPAWSARVGAVAAAECYVNSDVFGDSDEAVCLFSYAGTDPHALVMAIDYNAGGMLRDGWVTSRVAVLLERCRRVDDWPPDRPVRGAFRPVTAAQARRLLEAALTATNAAVDPPVGESFPAYHAFIRARIRALSPTEPVTEPAGPPFGGSATALASQDDAPGWLGAEARRLAWSDDRQTMLVVEFLASDEAEDLSDRKAASRCADHIINYGCNQDFGRPLRMSPAKVELFMLDWLPRKIMLLPSEQHAMPHVLAAWARWAGQRRELPQEAIEQTVDAVYDSMATFTRVYHDPATFGLDAELVARLLPDADLEALPRRAFAFPLLQGNFDGVDLSTLDPSQPQARRTLLAADHDDAHGRPAHEQHISHHLILSDRLWRGDPPELWEAAQRLLDRGEHRHAVQHTLMYLIRDTGNDCTKLAAELANLP